MWLAVFAVLLRVFQLARLSISGLDGSGLGEEAETAVGELGGCVGGDQLDVVTSTVTN